MKFCEKFSVDFILTDRKSHHCGIRYVHKIKDVGQLAQNPGTLDSDTRLPMMRMERKSKCKEEMREDMLSHPSSSLQEQTNLWGANAKYLTEHGTRKDIHSYRYEFLLHDVHWSLWWMCLRVLVIVASYHLLSSHYVL
jgi:hypothetical protein